MRAYVLQLFPRLLDLLLELLAPPVLGRVPQRLRPRDRHRVPLDGRALAVLKRNNIQFLALMEAILKMGLGIKILPTPTGARPLLFL
jgi:hypothetical protein